MNKLKEYLWIRPNEWLDRQNEEIKFVVILPILPTLVINLYYPNIINIIIWFYLFLTCIYAIYRSCWVWLSKNANEQETEEPRSDYDFTPIFFKSATREHLYSALESAKLSRQLAAAKENTDEFDYWEIVIQDIENLIENYSE